MAQWVESLKTKVENTAAFTPEMKQHTINLIEEAYAEHPNDALACLNSMFEKLNNAGTMRNMTANFVRNVRGQFLIECADDMTSEAALQKLDDFVCQRR